jgi:hypothetical protein
VPARFLTRYLIGRGQSYQATKMKSRPRFAFPFETGQNIAFPQPVISSFHCLPSPQPFRMASKRAAEDVLSGPAKRQDTTSRPAPPQYVYIVTSERKPANEHSNIERTVEGVYVELKDANNCVKRVCCFSFGEILETLLIPMRRSQMRILERRRRLRMELVRRGMSGGRLGI